MLRLQIHIRRLAGLRPRRLAASGIVNKRIFCPRNDTVSLWRHRFCGSLFTASYIYVSFFLYTLSGIDQINHSPYRSNMPTKPVTRRGQSKAPPRLKVFIDSANQRELLPDLGEVLAGEGAEIRLSRILKSLNKEQREFLGSPTDRDQFRDRYDALRSAQRFLPRLALPKAEERDEFDLETGVMSLPPVSVNLYIAHDGRMSASGTFLNAIVGVPRDRIRHCAWHKCNNVFWATRVNSECCCQKHRKAYNQKNFRGDMTKTRARKRSKSRGR